jgi:hypothetical protein
VGIVTGPPGGHTDTELQAMLAKLTPAQRAALGLDEPVEPAASNNSKLPKGWAVIEGCGGDRG